MQKYLLTRPSGLLLALGLLSLAACGAGDKDAAALKALAEDPEYRTAVSDSISDANGTAEEENFENAMKMDTHNLYIAFLETYPNTVHRAEIDQRLKRFRLFETKETRIINSETLADMCWPTSGFMSHWRKDGNAVGMMTGGPRVYFGPMMIWSESGSIQLIGGSFTSAEDGYEFAGGTSLIYSTKCHETPAAE